MSDDKLKELQELENEAGGKKTGKSGERPPSEQTRDEEFRTRELSLQDIEKIKLKMEMEKTGETQTPVPIQQELPFEDLESPEPQAPPEPPDEIPEIEGAATDQEVLKVTDELPPSPAEQYPELEKFAAAARSSISPVTRTLMVVVVALLAIMLYFMFQKDEVPPVTGTTETADSQPAMVTEDMRPPDEDTTAKTTTETATGAETAVPGDTEPPPPIHEFSDDDFQGEAPMEVRPEGPVISEAGDPEIAAVGDALKVRAASIDGSKTSTRGGITSTVTSGKFQGFSVIHTYQKKNEEVLKNETVILTPSRGKVIIKDNFLDSVRQTDYERFQKDLEVSGLEVIKKVVPEEGIISVQLRVTAMFGKPVNPEFLIGPGSVGAVKLEMPIDEMKSALSSVQYTVVDKRILEEDIYYNTYKVLDRRNSPLFFVTEKEGKVWGIRVLSEKYKTAMGIGLGDTLNKLRIYYLKNRKVTISTTPDGAPFISVEGEESRFFLQGEGLNFEKQFFPGALKVTDILLGGSPYIK